MREKTYICYSCGEKLTFNSTWFEYVDGSLRDLCKTCYQVVAKVPQPHKKIIDYSLLSDGYHTFADLYEQRLYLFACIVNTYPDLCWKTRKHADGKAIFDGGWFLVTVETPEGAYGYHYKDEYWNLFECEELDVAKSWDGYTNADVSRVMSLIKGVKSTDDEKGEK